MNQQLADIPGRSPARADDIEGSDWRVSDNEGQAEDAVGTEAAAQTQERATVELQAKLRAAEATSGLSACLSISCLTEKFARAIDV
jgi:hypothetical protein